LFVATAGQLIVEAVSFDFDRQYFYIRSHTLQTSRKYKNVAAGHSTVSLILDDWADGNPRGIKLHGTARIVQRAGRMCYTDYLAIRPTVSWHWGIEGSPVFKHGVFTAPKTIW